MLWLGIELKTKVPTDLQMLLNGDDELPLKFIVNCLHVECDNKHSLSVISINTTCQIIKFLWKRLNEKIHPNFSAYLMIISRMLSLYEASMEANFCVH